MQPEELPGEFPVSWAVASGLDARGLLLWQDLSSHFTFELHLSWLPPPLPASWPCGPALGDASPRPPAGCLPGPSPSGEHPSVSALRVTILVTVTVCAWALCV